MQASKAWIETCVDRVEARKAAFEAVFFFKVHSSDALESMLAYIA